MSAPGEAARRGLTPSQTIGPFFHDGLALRPGEPGAAGAIRVGGRIADGDGDPVADAMVETWQDGEPVAAGGPAGFRRVQTDAAGEWSVLTVKPPALGDPALGLQAPHLDVAIFARGLLRQLVTRIYFADEAEANAADPVLGGIEAERRGLLIASADDGGYRLDIHLQGRDETPFLDF